MAFEPAIQLVSIKVAGDGDPVLDSDGKTLYEASVIVRTEKGTKVASPTMSFYAANAVEIRQTLRAHMNAVNAAEKKAKPIIPAPIAAIVGVPVNTTYAPVTDWDAAPIIPLP